MVKAGSSVPAATERRWLSRIRSALPKRVKRAECANDRTMQRRSDAGGEDGVMHRIDRIREEIAQEAARLMFEEGVKEYRDAKRKAARRFGRHKAVSLGSHLPFTPRFS